MQNLSLNRVGSPSDQTRPLAWPRRIARILRLRWIIARDTKRVKTLPPALLADMGLTRETIEAQLRDGQRGRPRP